MEWSRAAYHQLEEAAWAEKVRKVELRLEGEFSGFPVDGSSDDMLLGAEANGAAAASPKKGSNESKCMLIKEQKKEKSGRGSQLSE